jgi:hypothetical protein
LKFSDQRRKSKSRIPEETGGKPPPGPPGSVGPGRRPALVRGPVRSGFSRAPLISHF